jgi:CHAT domain-containing protein
MRIASLTPSPLILLGADASEQELYQLSESGQLSEYSIIHVATHALIDDARPERSALVLSQVDLPDPLASLMARSRVYDGLLTAREIVGEWKVNADLVTLSACETGLGKKIGGEGYIGLSQAFFQAGARSLIVSLWKVNDEATSILMQKFYENYFGTGTDHRKQPTKAEALQKAKQYLRTYAAKDGQKPFAHPYYWSAFILIGDCGR